MARYTPEFLASVRHAYEDTDEPMRAIATRHEIGITTLQTLVENQGWAKRSQRTRDRAASAVLFEQGEKLMATLPPRTGQNIDAEYGTRGPAASAAPQAATGGEPPPSPAARLEALVLKEIAAEEAARADLDALPRMRGEAERCARTLVILGQALQMVQKLRAEEKTVPAQAELPRDIDEFREALARRIEAFVAAHGHEEDEPPEESEDD